MINTVQLRMPRLCLALACFLLNTLVCSAHASNTGLPLQSVFEQALPRAGLAGALWSTVGPGGVTATAAAGLKNVATGERMAVDTRVHVGSVAKTLLALGVLRLVTDSKLTLDTPVAALLPGLAFTNPWRGGDPVRVRHLLAHTSGLDNIRFWQMFSLEPRPDTPLAAGFAGDASLLTVHARPSSRYAYSNMNYALLGMVIEAVSGERYERYLDTKLLRPLGMADSTFEFVTQEGPFADKRLAMGHFEQGAPQAAVPIYLRPAGQFTTTAADMARLAVMLMGDGAGLVRADLMQQLDRPAGTDAALAGLTAGHGLALAVRDRHGAIGACHPGGTVGYVAMLCVYRPQNKAFFIAFNADSEGADYEQFYKRLIADLALSPQGVRAKPANVETPPVAPMADWPGWYVPMSFTVSSLAWTDVVFNFRRLDWDGTLLHLIPFQGASKALSPAGGLLFQASDRIAPSHVLMRSDDGRRFMNDGLRTYEQVPWGRMLWLWGTLAAGLAGLAYVLVWGLWCCVIRRRSAASTTATATTAPVLTIPLASILALLLPVPFFYTQSFLQLGDRTAASLLLAAATGLLPFAMAWGLWRARQRGHTSDRIALAAVLQLLAVLAAWGLVPFRLWQ